MGRKLPKGNLSVELNGGHPPFIGEGRTGAKSHPRNHVEARPKVLLFVLQKSNDTQPASPFRKKFFDTFCDFLF